MGRKLSNPQQLVVGTLRSRHFRAKADRTTWGATVDILLSPARTFTFAGKMTFVDLRAGYVAIADQSGANT
jgi:hypothetical protein